MKEIKGRQPLNYLADLRTQRILCTNIPTYVGSHWNRSRSLSQPFESCIQHTIHFWFPGLICWAIDCEIGGRILSRVRRLILSLAILT